VLSPGVALIVIDGTLVNVERPFIMGDLDLDFTEAHRVSTLYTLVFAGPLITTGRLGDRLGRRRLLFAAGVIVFVAAGLLAGTARSTTHYSAPARSRASAARRSCPALYRRSTPPAAGTTARSPSPSGDR
jgi:MFS family permease